MTEKIEAGVIDEGEEEGSDSVSHEDDENTKYLQKSKKRPKVRKAVKNSASVGMDDDDEVLKMLLGVNNGSLDSAFSHDRIVGKIMHESVIIEANSRRSLRI